MDLLPLSQIFISIYFNCDLSPCQFFIGMNLFIDIFVENKQTIVCSFQNTVGAIHELPLLQFKN